jgi:hypothetical protein
MQGMQECEAGSVEVSNEQGAEGVIIDQEV